MTSIWFLTPSPPSSQPVRALLRPLPNLARQPNDANHDNITGAELGDVTIPTPYGWQAVATIDVGTTAVSPVQPHSPPGTIFFNGNDDTRVHSFNAGNGIKYFNLMSIYNTCAVDVPTSCTSKPLALRRVVVRSLRPSCLIRVPLILSTSSF
ncbi:hypothetical protein ABVK25_000234 [Lepraria finkii]|uniref:Uncharacterized protein n=1 Tax=Lepraria finkii TaxID=1340010 RepID=A0ABR4BMB5_9LECA